MKERKKEREGGRERKCKKVSEEKLAKRARLRVFLIGVISWFLVATKNPSQFFFSQIVGKSLQTGSFHGTEERFLSQKKFVPVFFCSLGEQHGSLICNG
jgi:hypothetical protein